MAAQAQEQVKKVVIGIPNEGHTLPEAYDNHLIHSYRMGVNKIQTEWENQNFAFKQLLKKYLPPAKYKGFIDTAQEKGLTLPANAKFNPIRYEFHWFTVGRILTPLAREKLARQAVEADMDYLIMYDDDMVLPPEMALALLKDMEKHPEIDVLAPLAFMRSEPHYAVMYTTIEGYDGVRHQDYYSNQFVKNYPKNKLVECDAVGFGAACIRVSLLKKMREPYFMSTTNTGEDIWFCVNAKQQAKARIFMDTRIKLGHLSNPQIIDEAYREKYIQAKGEEIDDLPNKYESYDE